MKTNYNWYDLLVLTGFSPLRGEKDGVNLYLNYEDNNYLDTLLSNTKASFEKENGSYFFTSTPPQASVWFEEMKKLERGMESGSHVRTENIEFPLNAIVMNFKRLNMETVESCKGFHNPWQQVAPINYRGPYVTFRTLRSAILAETIFSAGGYRCEIGPDKRLYIHEKVEGVLEMGLYLNKINCAYDFQKPLKDKREVCLLELLDIPGESGEEQEIRSHLMPILKDILDSVWEDNAGNVLGEILVPDKQRKEKMPTLLLSAHMDVRNSTGEGKAIIREGKTLRRDDGILGADDRAGIAIILNILNTLTQYQLPCHLKLVFTVEEEIGSKGAKEIDRKFFEGVDFAISLDRSGTNDIVYKTNGQKYCDKSETEFIKSCSSKLWRNSKLWYAPVEGGKSDLRVWSERPQPGVPSVNLSIGYFDEHTSNERLELDTWHRVQDLVLEAIYYKMTTPTGYRS